MIQITNEIADQIVRKIMGRVTALYFLFLLFNFGLWMVFKIAEAYGEGKL